MENLNERAANYAAEKVNELLAKAIAQAYKDGYNNGYKECADDHDIDLYEDVDFVDLDLPSGLLWSSRYRMGEENKPLYLTYEEASTMDIPTEEQFNELVENCNWSHLMGSVCRGGYSFREPVGKYCNSVNGECISFCQEGMKYIGSGYAPYGIYFWIRDDVDEAEKKSVFIKSELQNKRPIIKIEKVDASTAKMPVMLVRNK